MALHELVQIERFHEAQGGQVDREACELACHQKQIFLAIRLVNLNMSSRWDLSNFCEFFVVALAEILIQLLCLRVNRERVGVEEEDGGAFGVAVNDPPVCKIECFDIIIARFFDFENFLHQVHEENVEDAAIAVFH